MEKEYFLGPIKVESVELVKDFKTNSGKDVLDVKFANGHSQIMPKLAFDAMKREETCDMNTVIGEYMDQIAGEILTVLVEHHITGENMDSLMGLVKASVVESFDKAVHKVWVGDRSIYTPRTNALLERSLLEADRVLRGNVKE